MDRIRGQQGLAPLLYHGPLVGWAVFIAEDNARRGVLDHRDRFGRWPYQRYPGASEVLAAGHPDFAAAIEGWLDSPGHRRILLSPRLARCGVGWAVADGGPWPWIDGLTRWWAVMLT